MQGYHAGPQLNYIKKKFTSRDPLGIEGVAASISAEICPIVNIVTPRPFYWAFLTWLYYDFHKNYSEKDKNEKKFNEFVKRQDYFFVLANLLADTPERSNMAGVRYCEKVIERNRGGLYQYQKNYLVARFGGMQYYNAGCESMNFIWERNPENDQVYSFPKIHKLGEEMALAFEERIKRTEYYRHYRLSKEGVPENILRAYGKSINISMEGFDKCKNILREGLFEKKRYGKLAESAEYIKYLEKAKVRDFGTANLRNILYDTFSPRGDNKKYDKSLKSIVLQWEIVVGRHYLAIGLEMIFLYLFDQLTEPMTPDEWVNQAINNSEFSFNLQGKLERIIPKCVYDYEDRESMVDEIRRFISPEKAIEYGICLILSVYNRFRDRQDYDEEYKYLSYGEDDSISIDSMIKEISARSGQSVMDFITFVIKSWVINRHYETSFEKMLQGRDGFYYEIIDERYKPRPDKKYNLGFQGIRLAQLHQVMVDLDVL